MISYPLSVLELQDKVDACSPTWRARAASYVGQGNIWSEIKDVWIDLQHQKCAYCECKFADKEFGRINFDVEHFRPKNGVEDWPTLAQIAERPRLRYGFSTGSASADGYRKLALNIQNYAVACKECNTIFKGSAFPIEGARLLNEDDYVALRAELPLLILPVGNWGDDAAELIRFVDGFIACPVAHADRNFRRALVTIDFFRLNEREELLRERCFLIQAMCLALYASESPEQVVRSIAANTLSWMRSDGAPHRGCLRDYEGLYKQDRAKAEMLALKASELLKSVGYRGNGFRDSATSEH